MTANRSDRDHYRGSQLPLKPHHDPFRRQRLFRYYSTPVYAELREFLATRGYHPVAGIGAFIDTLGFAAS